MMLGRERLTGGGTGGIAGSSTISKLHPYKPPQICPLKSGGRDALPGTQLEHKSNPVNPTPHGQNMDRKPILEDRTWYELNRHPS